MAGRLRSLRLFDDQHHPEPRHSPEEGLNHPFRGERCPGMRRRDETLYLFDVSGRERAKAQLLDDIPRLVTEFGDAVNVGQFYSSIYNMTPAHMDDIHGAMIENPDLEIVTGAGGERRKPNAIRSDDTLRMKTQRTMFPMFLKSKKVVSDDEG